VYDKLKEEYMIAKECIKNLEWEWTCEVPSARPWLRYDARRKVFADIEFWIRFPVLRKKVDVYVTGSDLDWPSISSGSLA